MQLTATSAAAIVAFFYAIPALTVPTTVCDGNTQPDWGDCSRLGDTFNRAPYQTMEFGPGGCYTAVVENIPANSLNCIMRACFTDDSATAPGQAIYENFNYLRAVCDGDTDPSSGGTTTDPNYSMTVSAMLNPDYDPDAGSKRRRDAGAEQQRTHARSWSEVERRDDGVCTDGNGDYMVIDTFKNAEKDGDMRPVTGRLPAGSSYMIAESDSMSIMVSTSVTVEAGFFDLFDASASVSVGSDYSVETTTGVTVKVDCDSGQEGIIYLAPTYTHYLGECTSNNNSPIEVFVPGSTQNNYFVQCLGS